MLRMQSASASGMAASSVGNFVRTASATFGSRDAGVRLVHCWHLQAGGAGARCLTFEPLMEPLPCRNAEASSMSGPAAPSAGWPWRMGLTTPPGKSTSIAVQERLNPSEEGACGGGRARRCARLAFALLRWLGSSALGGAAPARYHWHRHR